MIPFKEQPFNEAPITFVEGVQRGGKSTTAIGRGAVHPVLKRTAEIYCKQHGINAKVILAKDIVKWVPTGKGTNRLIITARQAIILRNGVKESLIIPKTYPLTKEINVFCNFHLYGIPFHFCSFADLIRGLADGSIKNGYLIVDQTEIAGNAREGMSPFNRVLMKYGNQLGKRHLHTYLILPHERMSDWYFRFSATEHLSCSYNKFTQEVTVYVKKTGEGQKAPITYWAPQYWPYFNTDEYIDLTNGEINRALEAVG